MKLLNFVANSIVLFLASSITAPAFADGFRYKISPIPPLTQQLMRGYTARLRFHCKMRL